MCFFNKNAHRLISAEEVFDERLLVRQTRFERATPAFGGLYSIHLSYWRYEKYKKRRVFYRKLSASSLAILGYFVDFSDI